MREYLFDDPNHYNSIRLIHQRKYAVREGAINIEIIQRILNNVNIVSEPLVPFPQADSFERVVNLCELLKQKIVLGKEEITANYDFDERQTNYYTDAGRYLGLIDKKRDNDQVIYFLASKGNALFDLSIMDRQIEFVKLILSHLVFRDTLLAYFDNVQMPTKYEIVEIMKRSNLYKIEQGSTFFRRASTISGWIKWIMDLIEE